jgi:hypothetical protein
VLFFDYEALFLCRAILALPVPSSAVAAVADFARCLVGCADCCLFQFIGLFLVFQFQKVRDVEECVALQANVDKCRLHAGQNAGYTPVINRACQRIFVFAFVIDFRELIVF